MRIDRRGPGRGRRGATAVVVAVCMVPLVGATALVLDGGMLMGQRRQVQAVADAAAAAGGTVVYRRYSTDLGLDPSGAAAAAAFAIAADNGFPNDGSKVSLTVNIPPTSKSSNFAGKPGCVEVILTLNQPRYFSALWGSASVPVQARSVSQVSVTTTQTGFAGSILLLDPHGAGALTLTGSAKLTTNAAIQVNSDSSYTASNLSAGAINASNGAYSSDSGGASVVGNLNIPSYATPSTFFSKAPATGQASVSDPYASLAAPSASSLTAQSGPSQTYGSATINPGVYSGGLNLSSGGMTITMNPGIYYMKNGGFSVGNGVKVSGSGVLIYLDASGGSLSFQGGTTVTLSPPTTGAYSGIVFYQDRANASALNNIANGSTVNMTGTLYAPAAAMTIAGGASGAQYGTQWITKSLNLSNGVSVNINTPAGAGASGTSVVMTKPAVVE